MAQMDLETFTDQHGSIVINALDVYIGHMRETARECQENYEAMKNSPPEQPASDASTINLKPTPQGFASMAKTFNEAADIAEAARKDFEAMIEDDDYGIAEDAALHRIESSACDPEGRRTND